MDAPIDFHSRITTIFDFAYTSSSIRIPAITCREVGKIIHAGMFKEEVQKTIPAFSFSSDVIKHFDGNLNEHSSELATEVREIYSEMNKAWKLYDEEILFIDAEIAFIVGQLDRLFLSNPKHDLFGDALEVFRSRWAKQEGGQFFTDQRVTRLAVKMLNFDPFKGDDLVDICAGTGGFLIAGFNRIKELVDKENGTEQDVAQLAGKALLGQEVDREVASLGNGTLIARTGTYASSIIQTGNSLDVNSFRNSANRIRFDSHACIATNPPFGAKIPVRDKAILAEYELARVGNSGKSTLQLKGRSPDVLFVEQNVRLLKPGVGRLAIITPYQILSGPQSEYIRHWIIRNCHIEAVIDLPGETFQPHTGTKTSLLLVRRRERPLLDFSGLEEGRIFMATPRWIGHDRRGNTVYAKDNTGKSTLKVLTDIPEVEMAFESFRNGEDPSSIYKECFTTSLSEVLNDSLLRLNAQTYRPTEHHAAIITDKSQWEIKRIGDVVSKIFYPGRFKRDYVDHYAGAIPFLGGSNITAVTFSTDKWLRHDDPRLTSLAVETGWILITRSGSTGIVSSVPSAWNGYAISEHVIRIVPDSSQLDANYLLAFLRTKLCQEQLKKGVFGSVIDEISPDFIADIEIPIPRDKTRFNNIASAMAKAEVSRDMAISGISGAVGDLESLFGAQGLQLVA